MRKAAPPELRHAGFTLLELLVAIALMALLTTILLAGFQLASRSFQRNSIHLDRTNDLSVVSDFLRSHIAGARPIELVNRDYGAIAFAGRTGNIDFVGTAPQSAEHGGLYLYSIAFASGELRARWRQFDGTLPDGLAGGSGELLLGDLRRADFQYYGAASFGAELMWRNGWTGIPYLPLLVRLDLVFADGEHPGPLVVAPRLRPLRVIPVGAPPLADAAR